MHCPACGSAVPGASTFCPDCGHQLRARRQHARLRGQSGPLVIERRYLLGPQLGEGRNWLVFEGTDLETQREVAVRIAHPGLVRDPAFAAQLHADGERLERLRHPNIIPILRHGENKTGLVYRVTERARAPLLASVIHEGVLDWRAAFAILHQLCDVLRCMHTGCTIAASRPTSSTSTTGPCRRVTRTAASRSPSPWCTRSSAGVR